MLLLLLACHPRPTCADTETRRNGRCWPYEAGDPVRADVWDPSPGTTFQVQYTGDLDRTVPADAFDVDLFDVDQAEIDLLRANRHHVLCAFSAGIYEEGRPDADAFPAWTLGDPVDGVDGAWWVDPTSSVIQDIMRARIVLAGTRGCHGIDLHDVDGFLVDNGLALSATMQLEYDRFLADTAHRNLLSVALHDDTEQVADLAPWFDLGVSESCIVDDSCDAWAALTDADKAVFHVEYVDDWADAPARATEVCGRGPRLDTILKTPVLGPEYLACPADPD
jgi:hypothetical protein